MDRITALRGATGASVLADWAILTLAEQAGTESTPLPVTETAPVAGEQIMVGGFSQKYPFKMTADTDCRVRGVMPNGLILHDCAVMHGISGAPLLKGAAETNVQIIGLHVATGGRRRNHEPPKSGIPKRKKIAMHIGFLAKSITFSDQIVVSDQLLPNSSRATKAARLANYRGA